MLQRVMNWLRGLRSSGDLTYAQRLSNEIDTFAEDDNVHDLPKIFHYWSNRYLRPKLEQFGISDPEHFYFLWTKPQFQPRRSLRIVSVGAGNCDMEARLARRLVDAGLEHFEIDCLDINPNMLDRGIEHAQSLGVNSFLKPVEADFNHWQPEPHAYHCVIANQSLHHVTHLEQLFEAVQMAMAPGAVFLTCDMIGRNGHMRWPEALAAMQPFWDELPSSYRYNRLLARQEDSYINHDCSVSGFEGIRAQDILPLLVARFEFRLFIPFSNITTPFIDRCFGHHFDADGEWDRDFIDRLNAEDERGILSGAWKPTQMIAALSNEKGESLLVDPRLTPEFCVRRAGADA